ncbi:MAG: patatin-like phospholipase family protein [Ignavibacteriae bacterium]|nr:patatin-like phospholipase family protein [Ignavibacteriota bacterium]
MRQSSVFWFLLSAILCCLFEVQGQTKITYRPRFDSTATPRFSFYPFRVQKRPRVGVVLSGGGARGAAQIGVLRVLEQNDVPVDFISATSMGAIIGGLYASGYSTSEIESLALGTDWNELLSLSDAASRRDLAIDQKLAADWSFLVVRFQGLSPVIPRAVSSGMRLMNFLSEQTLQAVYHPNPTFDNLKVRFRAVTTDLVSGKRIVLDHGSLAEALRASSTVPLLFNPIEKDSMRLVDGGLVTNIPVDIAKYAGCDLTIAVNTTSGLRYMDELRAPWQTADQIMGIMMQLSNQEQLKMSDVVITPMVGRHLSSDFSGIDSLIRAGEHATALHLDSIRTLYDRALAHMDSVEENEELMFADILAEFEGDDGPDSLILKIKNEAYAGALTSRQIRHHIRTLYDTGNFSDVEVDVFPDDRPIRVVYRLKAHPVVRNVVFTGNDRVTIDSLSAEFRPLINRVLNEKKLSESVEGMLRLYRKLGCSLARVSTASFDTSSGVLSVTINEGSIETIDVKGGERTERSFVLREFNMKPGEVFTIGKAETGLTNLNSTNIFEYAYLEVSYVNRQPLLTIRLAELPSQLIRFGLRLDDERRMQGTIDIRDENFRGIGTELGLTLAGGSRNGAANLEFRSNRLFSPLFTFNIGAFASIYNSNVYTDDPNEKRPRRYNRVLTGEYSDIRWGGRIVVGAQLERLGGTTLEWSLQDARIRSVENANGLEEHYTLSLLKFGTVIDSRNSVPFPTSGINLKLSYEVASTNLLSDVGYNALRFMYESYSSWGRWITFHPRFSFGFADITMPLGQQFRLGGRESMFGTREDDRRGRQMLAANFEFRYRLPIDFVFDSYFKIRYDIGAISEIPEQIKFKLFRHGIGAELAFDTPIGQSAFAVGKSFYVARNLPNSPIQEGPLLFYFVLGYEL